MPFRLWLHGKSLIAGEELYQRVFGDKVLTVLNYGEDSPFAYVPPYCFTGGELPGRSMRRNGAKIRLGLAKPMAVCYNGEAK
jgi:hypothetical protein